MMFRYTTLHYCAALLFAHKVFNKDMQAIIPGAYLAPGILETAETDLVQKQIDTYHGPGGKAGFQMKEGL